MLTFKFFVFVGICVSFIDSIKKVRENRTRKNIVALVANGILLLSSIAILIDAFI